MGLYCYKAARPYLRDPINSPFSYKSDENEFCIYTVTDCGILPNPSNGMVQQNTTTFEAEATYVCSLGHTLDGPNTRVCMSSGLWSGAEPICARKFGDFKNKPGISCSEEPHAEP